MHAGNTALDRTTMGPAEQPPSLRRPKPPPTPFPVRPFTGSALGVRVGVSGEREGLQGRGLGAPTPVARLKSCGAQHGLLPQGSRALPSAPGLMATPGRLSYLLPGAVDQVQVLRTAWFHVEQRPRASQRGDPKFSCVSPS